MGRSQQPALNERMTMSDEQTPDDDEGVEAGGEESGEGSAGAASMDEREAVAEDRDEAFEDEADGDG